MEDIRRCNQKAWQAWTFVVFGLKRPVQEGRPPMEGEATDCAGVGFGAMRAGGVLPVKAAAGGKTVAGAYFRGRGACTQYDPKVILCAKTLDPKGDAYYSSQESYFVNPKMSVFAKTLDHKGDLCYFT